MNHLSPRNSNIIMLLALLSNLYPILSITNFVFGAESSGSTPTSFFDFLNSPFLTAVLSTVAVSAITYLAGRLRSVTVKLQVIPDLEKGQVENTKKMDELKLQVERNSSELKKLMEKMDSKMDTRFDNVSNMQRSIEKDMNEKVMDLVLRLRNYNSDKYNPDRYKE